MAAAHDLTMATSANGAKGSDASPAVTKVQELLLTPRFPFLAEPPKAIIPRLMERIPRQSGKEAASDTPSWARGIPRRVGEAPNDYAKRLIDDKYGPGNWRREGPDTEFNRIKKFGERAFRNPKEIMPFSADGRPEA
jgi:hypothetical protein